MPGLFYRREFLPTVAALLFIVVLAVHYWSLLPIGHIRYNDEYLTLDRTHSFVIRDDYLAVYAYNSPTFKKPPLQYWTSAYLIRQGADLEFALRFPSYLFGILTLISVGFLAYVLYPANPWVAPAAIALLAGSFSFWKITISGLLDSGAIFFCTMAITGCLLALSRPKWWYFVALAIGFSALQKAPVPVLLVCGIVAGAFATRKFHQVDLRATFLSHHFMIAAALTAIALLAWPAIQWLRFGSESFRQSHLDEMIGRFSILGGRIGVHRWTTNFFDGEWFIRVPAVLALAALPWLLRRLELLGLPLLVIAFAIAIKLSTGIVHPRYSVLFLPLLAAALAVAIVKIAPGRILPAAIVIALALSQGGPIRSARALNLLSGHEAHPIPLYQNISKELRSAETFLVCFPGPGKSGFNSPGWLAAVSYYASNGRPFHTVHSPEALKKLTQEKGVAPPFRGLCHTDSFEKLMPLLPGHEIVEQSMGFIHWTAR